MGVEFDEFAGNYEAALNQGLKFTGESKTYFAEGRMRWLARRLAEQQFQPRKALDFGCGTGGSLPFFFLRLGINAVLATDISEDSLAEAKRQNQGLKVDYQPLAQFKPPGDLDLAFCNGVFHHIPLAERASAVALVYHSLRPGGLFALWENNPWNPMTRFMMRRVPFDREAILVWPAQARRLLMAAGFSICHTDFLFIFPAFLAPLRILEPGLARLPLGGQYLVLSRKPGPNGNAG